MKRGDVWLPTQHDTMLLMRFFLVALSLVAMFIVSYLIWGDYFEHLLVGEKAADYIRSFGVWAWLIVIGLFIADVVLPIPATAVLATLGIVYGPWLGGLFFGRSHGETTGAFDPQSVTAH